MPHIVFEKLTDSFVPKKSADTQFVCEAISPHESKIIVKTKDTELLLTKKEKDSKEYTKFEILKSDKSTRPSKAYVIKKVLQDFKELYGVRTVFENISNLKDNTKQSNEFLKEIDYFTNNFNPSQEVWVEIGFGSGRHLLYQAKKNPNITFVGLEIHTPSIEQVLKQIELQEIKNVLILNYDARLFLEFLDSNSVGKIFVHFPVPWEKKPHRRVFSQEFVDESIRVLKVDGTLELRTDSREYFDFGLSILTQLSKCSINIDINKDLEISSKYEDRWKKQGKNIYDLTLINQVISDKINIKHSFDFGKIDIVNLDQRLPKKSIVKNDFFVHFENIFTINEGSMLIEVTFGSFNKPVSKFVFINKSEARYFQGNPLTTKANLKAHQKINEFLTND